MFRFIGLRATPVLTLLVVLALVVSAAGRDAELHAIRSQGGGDLPPRNTLEKEFGDWLNRSQACERELGGAKVRPMVLVAASGGGVRAAVWTTGVMDRLRQGGCARDAVFLSSGVSGGSVGLALSRTEGETPRSGEAKTLAEPNALSAAVAGLLAGDLFAGSTGLRIPSYGEDFAWRDRAALMETWWETKVPALAEPYDATVAGPGGLLVFNSAVAGRGCRVIISQVELTTGLDPHPAGNDRANCSGQTAQPAASLDLQDAYDPCVKGLSWATAAMLSARFPTVTPAGRISCDDANDDDRPDLQLIDGGYAEASGLGTLSDIAPMLMQVVRNHNATKPAEAPVVPVVLFLEDAARGDIVETPQGLATEVLVPLAGLNAKEVQTSSGTLLQRLATSIADPCPTTANDVCRKAVGALHTEVPHGIVIAAPLTKPSVEPPLGWTLSADSITRLTDALDEQAEGNCDPSQPIDGQPANATPSNAGAPDPAPPIRPGAYVCLSQLLKTLD